MSFVLDSWLTYFPVIEFHFDHNDRDTLEILVKSIDDSLLVLKQHRAFIHTFFLNMDLELAAEIGFKPPPANSKSMLREKSQEEDCVLQKRFRQARYLVEAKEAPQDFVDVGAYSSDLEAPELRRFHGDPLLADDFVRCGRKEIVYEDCLCFWIVSVPLPILHSKPKRTTIKHHEPPTADHRKSPNEVVDKS
ncbi:uncharacterized protein G2W53_003579 [Senna tora]|uniref:Uncharacterized protein n=1 Tax=Senna tora TaxID=362788 RepID=A0A834XA69_9FABA|nr:uncharacterized protein G2W53_003579 [Senna tora]